MSKVDRLLLAKTWRNLSELIELAEKDDNNKFLNKYRWALSLFAEYIQDTKSKIIVTLDGRDTAWKWSNIKRITEYLNPVVYDIKAFGIPKAEERKWEDWFKRYERFFPEDWWITFFDRSWYNRAFVEPVMWFCTEEEYLWFMENVNKFEEYISENDFQLIKWYLSITHKTQKERLENRNQDMKRWKSSFVDAQAIWKRNYYTLAKHNVLKNTDTMNSPWLVFDSNEKYRSASEIIKQIINSSTEISDIISQKLSIDLSPNPRYTRTAQAELERMEQIWDLKNMKKEFRF